MLAPNMRSTYLVGIEEQLGSGSSFVIFGHNYAAWRQSLPHPNARCHALQTHWIDPLANPQLSPGIKQLRWRQHPATAQAMLAVFDQPSREGMINARSSLAICRL